MFWDLLFLLLAHHSEELIKLNGVIRFVLTNSSHHGQKIRPWKHNNFSNKIAIVLFTWKSLSKSLHRLAELIKRQNTIHILVKQDEQLLVVCQLLLVDVELGLEEYEGNMKWNKQNPHQVNIDKQLHAIWLSPPAPYFLDTSYWSSALDIWGIGFSDPKYFKVRYSHCWVFHFLQLSRL